MWLISAAALLAAGFAVSAAMATAILERRGEIGLMRSLGASKGAIALLFYAETGLLAIFAGTLGYLAGSGLAAWLGARIFRGDGGAPEAILIPVLLPVVVALALVVAIGGSTPSIRAALRMNPPPSCERTHDGDIEPYRILRRSLIHRRARSISALIAMTVSAGVATALLTLYADLDTKLHKEFRSFGANIVLTAPANTFSRPTPSHQVQQAAGPDAIAAEFAYAVATTDTGTPVVVAGTDFDALNGSTHRGKSTLGPILPDDAALLGQRAAQFIGDEHSVTLTSQGKPITSRDQAASRPAATKTPASTSRSQPSQHGPTYPQRHRAPGPRRSHTSRGHDRTAEELPDVQVEPVRQLVEGESRIVDRTHALMYGAVLLIALTVAVSVLATLSASVLERRRDFALMKALGGSQGQLMGMFLLEALVLALAGVAAGFLVGSAAAWAISEVNFHTATLPHLSVLPLVLLLNCSSQRWQPCYPSESCADCNPPRC